MPLFVVLLVLPTRETQGEICLRVLLFVVLLGTAHKRDVRRDLFESVPACRPLWRHPRERRRERFVYKNVYVCRFLRHRPRERLRELSCLSFSLALPTRETQGEICLRVFLLVVLFGAARERDAGRDSFVRTFVFVVLFGTTHERDAGSYPVCRFLRRRLRERRREI